MLHHKHQHTYYIYNITYKYNMSTSNLLNSNDYEIYCQSIIVNGINLTPSGFTGATGATGPTGAAGMTGPAGSTPIYAPAAAIWMLTNLSQPIPDNSGTAVAFDSFGNISNFMTPPVDFNSTTGVLTCTKNCIYTATYQAGFVSSGGTGNRRIYIRQNNINYGLVDNTASTSSMGFISGSWSNAMKVGDTLQLFVYQNSGSPKNLVSSTTDPNNYTKMGVSFVYQL